jgi:hypothetical protein
LKSIASKTVPSVSSTRWGAAVSAIQRFLELEEQLVVVASSQNWPFLSASEIEVYNFLLVLKKSNVNFVLVFEDVQSIKEELSTSSIVRPL